MAFQSAPQDGQASEIELKPSSWNSAKLLAASKPVSEELVSEDDGIIKIHYHKMRADLDNDAWEALASCDIDGSGSLTLSEILSMSNRNKRLRSVVLACVIAIFILLGCMFCVSWAAAVLAEQTEVSGGSAMTSKGTSNIIGTKEEKETVPAAFASLLPMSDIQRIKEISLSGFSLVVKVNHNTSTNVTDVTDENESKGCVGCPEGVVAQVHVAVKHNSTYVEFKCQGGITVTIDHGAIHVKGLQGVTYLACGAASCSSISVKGVDVEALKKQAGDLGFVDTAGGDSGARRKAMRRSGSSGSCASPMVYRCRGFGLNCVTLGGCEHNGGPLGDKFLLNTTSISGSATTRVIPTIMQVRHSPVPSNAAWALNGYVAQVDGCAIQHGAMTVSAGFGGYNEAAGSTYPAGAYVNGRIQGIQRNQWNRISSTSTVQDVVSMWYKYTGTCLLVEIWRGSSMQRTFMACCKAHPQWGDNVGSFYAEVPRSLQGNVQGLAGTGTAGQEWIAGPQGADTTTAGNIIPSLNGQCPATFTKYRNADLLNGNSPTKPETHWSSSWMVDRCNSLFTYPTGKNADWYNQYDRSVAPPGASGTPTPCPLGTPYLFQGRWLYKVKVRARITRTTIQQACNEYGMKPVCDHQAYADGNCVNFGRSRHFSHPSHNRNVGFSVSFATNVFWYTGSYHTGALYHTGYSHSWSQGNDGYADTMCTTEAYGGHPTGVRRKLKYEQAEEAPQSSGATDAGSETQTMDDDSRRVDLSEGPPLTMKTVSEDIQAATEGPVRAAT